MAPVVFGDYPLLYSLLETLNPGKVFVLTDSNTARFCYPNFREQCRFPHELMPEVKAGERYKNLDSCIQLWDYLSERGADRHSLLLTLGGGVITDMGGFVAATYQRGMRFIHIPTTLLAMADASIGGKNGVDFRGLKNQIGLIREPEAVFIDTAFLNTLPPRHINAGYAEMLKISLVCDEAFWKTLSDQDLSHIQDWKALVSKAVGLKQSIVIEDLQDHGIRKLLNFGHTIGHAIESYALTTAFPLLHGEAVALGMMAELALAVTYTGFPEELLEPVYSVIRPCIPDAASHLQWDSAGLLERMKHDKKNREGKINFSLPARPGYGLIDQYCRVSDIADALETLRTC